MRWNRRTGILSVFTIILAVCCLAAPAMAATWVVNPDGTGDFTTIQAALESDWTSGDTIEIAYAVYKEPVAVDADGRELTITGIPSPAGDLPVLDGMDGTIELPPLDPDGWYGCGECSMFLYNGDFTISSLCVTNASNNGLVARAGVYGETVTLTDVVATENGWHGINIIYYDEAVLSEVDAFENGWAGIHVVSTACTEGTELLCQDNGVDGLQIRGGEAVLMSVVATGNGYRGVDVILQDRWVIPVDGEECSSALLSDIVVAGNARDGLFVRGSGTSIAEISDVESTGNGGEGVVLNGFADFAVFRVECDGNGVEPELPPALLADAAAHCCRFGEDDAAEEDAFLCTAEADAMVQATGVACELRSEGNGLFVVMSGNGTIDGVDASNNAAVGIVVDATGDVIIANTTADANGYLGILTTSVSDEYPLCADLIAEIDTDMDADDASDALDTFFSGMSAYVANATVVSDDEFVLGDGVTVFADDVLADGPDVVLTSVTADDNGYAGIGVLAPYVLAMDISANGNGASPTDTCGTISGAGLVGVSFLGAYEDISAVDNGGAGMAAAALVLGIEDALLTGNGQMAASDIHGPLFQTGLITVSLGNVFSGVHADENAGSGMLMTSVVSACDNCSATGNAYAGIVAADPLSLGIAALLVHSDLDIFEGMDAGVLSEEDRFYVESLSSPAVQDVMTAYGAADGALPYGAIAIDADTITEEDGDLIIRLFHQYLGTATFSFADTVADENELFGMAVVSPNVETDGFSADGNGCDGAGGLLALLGTGTFGLYVNGTFADTSFSENTGAGIVSVGVTTEYTGVTADDNGYAGIVTIDPVTLAAAALGAYFLVVDDSGDAIFLSTADTPEVTDVAMHADVAESAVAQEIVSTYYTGIPAGDPTGMVRANQAGLPMDDPMEVLLEHIEYYFTYAGVSARDVSASGNGYPGIVAIAPNVMMNGVTADGNGAANDDESDVISLAAGSGVIGLSIAGEYIDIAASGNTGAGVATAGVLTDMAACRADENGVGIVSLFVVGHHTEIGGDENSVSGIVLAGINGTLSDAAADRNAGPGIVCVDPVAAVLMYFTVSPDVLPSATADDAAIPSQETMALVCQLSGDANAASAGSDDRETAWDLIEWAIAHISSYEGDITDLNETEIMDLLLTHYLTGAELSLTEVSADENGWQGIVILSPSIVAEDLSADDNGYHGVALISPWKAVDAMGFVHPAEPLGDERLTVNGLSATGNDAAGLAISGAGGGFVTDVSCSENLVGTLLGDSDHLRVTGCVWENNLAGSVLCGGSRMNSLIPADVVLPEGALTDPTGSCDNVFANTVMDAGVVVLPNGTGNQFGTTFLDCDREIAADISGDGPYICYSTSGSWSPMLPPCPLRTHMAGCGIGVVGVAGWNTTVNVTYDYSHGYSLEYGKKLYPLWTVNATTPWDSWTFNQVTNDPVAMTVGPMEVPVCCPASVPAGEFVGVMYISPFWQEEESADDPGHDAFVASLEENRHGYLNKYGVFVPYAPGEELPGDVPQDMPPGTPVGGTDDGTGPDGDDTTPPPQSGGDGNADGTTPVGTPAGAGVTATATAAATGTPVPTTTPAGVLPVCGALGILGALAVIRRR